MFVDVLCAGGIHSHPTDGVALGRGIWVRGCHRRVPPIGTGKTRIPDRGLSRHSRWLLEAAYFLSRYSLSRYFFVPLLFGMRDAGDGRGDQIFAFVLVDSTEVEREARSPTFDDAGPEIIDFSRIGSEAGECSLVGE